jgi:hypothetical protein
VDTGCDGATRPCLRSAGTDGDEQSVDPVADIATRFARRRARASFVTKTVTKT